MSKKCSFRSGLFEIMWSVLDQVRDKRKTKNITLEDIKTIKEIINLIKGTHDIDIER